MARLAYALLLGVVGAGIVHIAILLLLPLFSERDAWSRLATAADLYVMTAADGSDGSRPTVEAPDPFFRASACRFDLQDGPVRLKADGSVPFWSASIYDRGGQNVYNFNDRTATDGALDFVIVTPAQMIDMRKDLPAEHGIVGLRRGRYRRRHRRGARLRARRQLDIDHCSLSAGRSACAPQ